jgi:uncharacterized membrane protein YgcG
MLSLSFMWNSQDALNGFKRTLQALASTPDVFVDFFAYTIEGQHRLRPWMNEFGRQVDVLTWQHQIGPVTFSSRNLGSNDDRESFPLINVSWGGTIVGEDQIEGLVRLENLEDVIDFPEYWRTPLPYQSIPGVEPHIDEFLSEHEKEYLRLFVNVAGRVRVHGASAAGGGGGTSAAAGGGGTSAAAGGGGASAAGGGWYTGLFATNGLQKRTRQPTEYKGCFGILPSARLHCTVAVTQVFRS